MPPNLILLIDSDATALSPLIEWLSNKGYDAKSATSCAAAEAALRRFAIEVIISEWRLPDRSGAALVQRLKQLAPRAPIIFLAQAMGKTDVIEALRWCRGFDCFDKPLSDFGELGRSLAAALATPKTDMPGNGPATLPPLAHLNAREREILALVGLGMDNRLIADQVGLGEKTIRNQLTVIYEKLGVINRTQAAILARELGL